MYGAELFPMMLPYSWFSITTTAIRAGRDEDVGLADVAGALDGVDFSVANGVGGRVSVGRCAFAHAVANRKRTATDFSLRSPLGFGAPLA